MLFVLILLFSVVAFISANANIASLTSRLTNVGRTITSSTPYQFLQGSVAFSLISGIDAVTTHDWVKYGLIDQVAENSIASALTSVGLFHLFCAPTSAIIAWQKSQPIAPAFLKTSLIGGLALAQTILQDDENVIQFPWKSSNIDDTSDMTNSDSLVQKISLISQTSSVTSFKQAIANYVAGDYDSSVIDSMIDDKIFNNGVVIFSWLNCPFCKKTKQIFSELEPKPNVMIVELDEGDLKDSGVGKQIRAQLGKRTGRTSLPSVWIKGEFYGGCNDGSRLAPKGIKGLLDDGSLIEILKSAKAYTKSSNSNSNRGITSGGIDVGGFIKDKLGPKGMKMLGLVSVSPYLMFAIRGLLENSQ